MLFCVHNHEREPFWSEKENFTFNNLEKLRHSAAAKLCTNDICKWLRRHWKSMAATLGREYSLFRLILSLQSLYSICLQWKFNSYLINCKENDLTTDAYFKLYTHINLKDIFVLFGDRVTPFFPDAFWILYLNIILQ